MLQVTPNGSSSKDTHPAVPITLGELLADLHDCFLAGADAVHLHVRDTAGEESLDPEHVNQTCRRVRRLASELGIDAEISLTTGAWIVPELHERVAMIREWEGVDCATANVIEDGFEQVVQALQDAGVGVDIGLWAPSQLPRLLGSGALDVARRVSIELWPGKPYSLQAPPEDRAQELNAALDAAGSTCPRLTHGEREWTWQLVEEAFRRGHATRVGFEDSLFLPDGTTANSNAQLVTAALALRPA